MPLKKLYKMSDLFRQPDESEANVRKADEDLMKVDSYTLNSCFISHGIKSKLAFKRKMECNNQRRYSII
jgi:hypothetical protein